MKLTFCGVRGSTPAPGAEFVRYGGNTACVHIELSDGTDLVLDAGTGIRELGKRLAAKKSPVHILLSHNHWDHIQGFPFFIPIYQPGRQIIITPGLTDMNQPEAVLDQMTGSFFPVHRNDLGADIRVEPRAVEEDDEWYISNALVSRMKMNHPGGGSCYTVKENGHKIAYITDNELYPPYEKQTDFLDFVGFAKGSDILIHDAQYLVSDMPAKSGWGHSVAEEAVKLAMACGVRVLALYSHDPERTDDDIDAIIAQCNEVIEAGGMDLVCYAARENQVIEF
ncbi:MBL fold metallo-hydrolase [Glaciecola sp. MH2013]|uniref:MBL fold metallo-hydrolase n=1 Tax=Glaciecola sp. MH2013 TaxID=2785524 RepID=UPI00189F8B74|nr:MBL fold metallo-hydrolase [Glaciecola sp. MH2013]MBF7074767.1 MBL fold metallo-hydrolase [Glaciecola sp. MH2013]